MSEPLFYCEASMWRGEWSTLRSVPCGRPGKVKKFDGNEHSVGLCGIHARAKHVQHFQDRNTENGAGGWVVAA